MAAQPAGHRDRGGERPAPCRRRAGRAGTCRGWWSARRAARPAGPGRPPRRPADAARPGCRSRGAPAPAMNGYRPQACTVVAWHSAAAATWAARPALRELPAPGGRQRDPAGRVAAAGPRRAAGLRRRSPGPPAGQRRRADPARQGGGEPGGLAEWNILRSRIREPSAAASVAATARGSSAASVTVTVTYRPIRTTPAPAASSAAACAARAES